MCLCIYQIKLYIERKGFNFLCFCPLPERADRGLGVDQGRLIIGGKIVETLFLNGVTSENKTNHTPPPPLHPYLVFVVSTNSSNSSTTLHGGDGG